MEEMKKKMMSCNEGPNQVAIRSWNQISSPVDLPVSLDDVMSEELAKDLQEKENAQYGGGGEGEGREGMIIDDLHKADNEMDEIIDGTMDDEFAYINDGDTSNDLMLARLLQLEYDKEHDAKLKKEEKHINKDSKISVSFDRFKRLPDGSFLDSDEDEDESLIDPENREWDSFEKTAKENAGIILGSKGFAKQGNTIMTKHDPTICGRRNACRVMDLRSNISTGDGGGFDMKLPNQVFNALKVHSKSEGKRAARLHEKKEKSTAEHVMDVTSKLILYKLLNRGILDEINGTINTGKEANVYHGIGGDPENQINVGEVAIKVYKTTLVEFKNREPYIKDDYRFKDRFSKQNPRKVIHLWAEKEMRNLLKIKKAGILCPEVVMLKKHVLVMTFIGNDAKPAPTLKEADLSYHELVQAYNDVVDIMKKLYLRCDLVHADLSEYNLLYHNNKIWVIDVSQSLLKDHPQALRFLLRDCYNITKFFKKRELPEILTSSQLFNEITGKNLADDTTDEIELLSKIDNYERNEDILTHEMSLNGEMFDEMFNRSCKEREQQSKKGNISKSPPKSNLAKSPPKVGKK